MWQVLIPVDLRDDISSPKTSHRLGCKVASILATVPTGTEAAIPRLWATRHRIDEVKASADPVVAYGAATIIMTLLPQSLGSAVLESITNKVRSYEGHIKYSCRIQIRHISYVVHVKNSDFFQC
jgi:hypothetical protein